MERGAISSAAVSVKYTPRAAEIMTTKAPVFVREATGLRREVSLLDAVALNVSNMSSGTAIAVIGFTLAILPSVSGVNLLGTTLIGFLFSIPEIIVYTMLSARMPRTGGDYVWMSRTLGPIGAPLTFAEYIWGQFSFLALIALSTVFAIGSVFLTMGNQAALGIAVPGMNPSGQFAIGAIIFMLLMLVNVFKPRYGYKLVTACLIFGLLTLALAVGAILYGGSVGVGNYVHSLDANLTYTSLASSYSGPTFSLGPSVFILPVFAAFTFPWLNAGPGVASELKGKRTVKWNVLLGAIISFGVLLVGFGSMYAAGGFAFTTEALANPTLVFNYSFNFWTWAMGVSPSPALAWVIGLGWIVWNIAILAYAVIICSRYIFAEAFDRVLPEKFAYVSDKYGSPVYGLLLVFIITVIVMGLTSFLYGTFTSLYGTWILGMSYFALVGIVAVIWAMKHEKGGAKTLLSVSGILMAAVFIFLAYQFIASPAVWGGNVLAYGYIVAGLVIGAVIYVTSWRYHKARGIDISLAFKQIPPE